MKWLFFFMAPIFKFEMDYAAYVKTKVGLTLAQAKQP